MTHPIVACASDIRASLKGVASVNPTFMTTDDKAVALGELVRAEAQLVELRLRVLADAGDLAVATAAKDAAGWLAKETRTRFADARADLALATALDREHPVLAAAMRDGDVDPGAGAGDPPRHRPRSRRAWTPTRWRRRRRTSSPRRACSVRRSSPGSGAGSSRWSRPRSPRRPRPAGWPSSKPTPRQLTRFTMRRQGDGTTRISGRLPDAAATRFATYLEAYANPRKKPADGADDAATGDPFTRLPYPRRMGEALCQFLESIDITRLPIHGGDATTLVITMSLDSLRAELATAGLHRRRSGPRRRAHRRHHHRSPGPTPGLHREDPPRRPRRRQHPPRPRPRPPTLQPRTTQGAPDPRHDLPRRRMRHSRHLVPRPTTSTPGQPEAGPTSPTALLLCSHHHHRAHDTGLPHRPPPQRRPQVPPTRRRPVSGTVKPPAIQ